MALSAFLDLKSCSPSIVGPCQQKGREGFIEVIAASHEIVAPRDPASGLPTGKVMNKPLTLTWELDHEIALVYNALTQNQNLTKMLVKFYRPTQAGGEEFYYSIELQDASVASVSFKLFNNKIANMTAFRPCVDVSFTYRCITWSSVKPAVLATCDWLAPGGTG